MESKFTKSSIALSDEDLERIDKMDEEQKVKLIVMQAMLFENDLAEAIGITPRTSLFNQNGDVIVMPQYHSPLTNCDWRVIFE